MSEPVYFGVVRANGKETPRRFFAIVPACYTGKYARQTVIANRPGTGAVYGPELVYCTRLDLMPNGDAMINAPLADLMIVYRSLRDKGKLPPEDRGMKPKDPPKPPGAEVTAEVPE